MVRLSCKAKNCSHVWLETKKQREAEHVFCPKCFSHHHSHSKPINPPKVAKTKYEETPKKKKTPYANPPEEFSIHLKGLNGRTVGFRKGYRTKEKKKGAS